MLRSLLGVSFFIFDHPGPFNFICSKSSFHLFLALNMANAGFPVGPWRKNGHPALLHERLMQVPVLKAGIRGINRLQDIRLTFICDLINCALIVYFLSRRV